MPDVFLYMCERCEDLTENKPDHRGRVRCQSCGGHAAEDGFTVTVLGAAGVRSLTRAESLTPVTLRKLVDGLDEGATVLAISTPASILADLTGPAKSDPYAFERAWLSTINREDLLPEWGEAA